jgi:homoserine kinase
VVSAAALHGRAVTVSVPATTANLGAGFDTLGMALDLRNLVSVRVTAVSGGHTTVHVEGEGKGELPAGPANPVALAVRAGLRIGGCAEADALSLIIECTNAIPLARGLGSSAAAQIGGLVAGTALATGSSELLADGRLAAHILAAADEVEGHPDNVAAALFGGIVAAARDGERILIRCIAPVPDATAVVIIPERRASTADMRAALPLGVPLADAAHNVARTALGVLALERGEVAGFTLLAEDRLHQPYRGAKYPELEHLLGEAMVAGAASATLSGSGPTLLAMVDVHDDPEAAETLATAMEGALDTVGLDAVVDVLPVAHEGAVIESIEVPQ